MPYFRSLVCFALLLSSAEGFLGREFFVLQKHGKSPVLSRGSRLRASPQESPSIRTEKAGEEARSRRRSLVESLISAPAALALSLAASSATLPPRAHAVSASEKTKPKQKGLTPAELRAIVEEDLSKRQFLVTGLFTRSVYDESCLFQDEIDTYKIDDFIEGIPKLFNGERSHVDLVGDIQADDKMVSFRFSEILAFNVPLVWPKVEVTGRVELTRGPEGLITKYREFWDKSPSGVVQTLRI